eukprot:g3975.t1
MFSSSLPLPIARVPSEENFRRRAGKSIDNLSPGWYHPNRRMNRPAAVFSLVSTIVGGGVLSLPFAFSKAGLVLGPLLLLFCGVISDFSIVLLVLCARMSGAASYDGVASAAFGPKAKVLTTWLIFLLTWVCCVAYIILMGDMWTPLVDTFFHLDIVKGSSAHHLLLAAITAFVSPLGVLRTLNALRFTSMLCVVSVIVLGICIGYRSIEQGDVIHNNGWQITSEMLFPEGFLSGSMFCFPIFSISYLCHFNVLGTHSEMKDPKRTHVRGVIHSTIFICFILYVLVGVLGFFYNVEDTCGDILENFKSNDIVINVGRVGLAATLFFSFPLLVLPCRDALWVLISNIRLIRAVGSTDALLDCDDLDEADALVGSAIAADNAGRLSLDSACSNYAPMDGSTRERSSSDTLLSSVVGVCPIISASISVCGKKADTSKATLVEERETEENCGEMTTAMRAFLSIFVTLSSFICAVLVGDVVIVWTFMGSTIAVIIGYVLPAACYLRLRYTRPYPVKKTLDRKQILSVLLLIFSLFIMVSGIMEASRHFSDEPKPICLSK